MQRPILMRHGLSVRRHSSIRRVVSLKSNFSLRRNTNAHNTEPTSLKRTVSLKAEPTFKRTTSLRRTFSLSRTSLQSPINFIRPKSTVSLNRTPSLTRRISQRLKRRLSSTNYSYDHDGERNIDLQYERIPEESEIVFPTIQRSPDDAVGTWPRRSTNRSSQRMRKYKSRLGDWWRENTTLQPGVVVYGWGEYGGWYYAEEETEVKRTRSLDDVKRREEWVTESELGVS